MGGLRRLQAIWRWRPLVAYGFVFTVVAVSVYNLIADWRVSYYEREAARDPGSPYLKGMSPRELGPVDSGKAVLFVHGFIGGQSNFHDLPDRVAEAGWHVRTMRLPGHGTSPREFERISADDLIAGVLTELRELKQHYGTVVVVGHSMGGALSALAAADEPVDGLVLCAPFFGLTRERVVGISSVRLIRAAATVLRWIPRPEGRAPVNKPENRSFVDAYSWFPMRGTLAALEVGERANAPEVADRIAAPVLLIHSRTDRLTSPEAAARALARFRSPSKKIIWLEKSDHVIFWDYDESIVVESVLSYLKEVENHDPDQPSVRE